MPRPAVLRAHPFKSALQPQPAATPVKCTGSEKQKCGCEVKADSGSPACLPATDLLLHQAGRSQPGRREKTQGHCIMISPMRWGSTSRDGVSLCRMLHTRMEESRAPRWLFSWVPLQAGCPPPPRLLSHSSVHIPSPSRGISCT